MFNDNLSGNIFEADFLEQAEVIRFDIIRRFRSRNNEVFLIKNYHKDGHTDYLVNKCFECCNERMETESLILRTLRNEGISPGLIYKGKTSLVLEYIPGVTMLELIYGEADKLPGDGTSTTLDDALKLLSRWLKLFHKVTARELGHSLVLIDPNLRNFILNTGLYGIDFEAVRIGRPEEGIGRICANLLACCPKSMKWRRGLANTLVDQVQNEMQVDTEHVYRAMENELAMFRIRRGCSFINEKSNLGLISHFS